MCLQSSFPQWNSNRIEVKLLFICSHGATVAMTASQNVARKSMKVFSLCRAQLIQVSVHCVNGPVDKWCKRIV